MNNVAKKLKRITRSEFSDALGLSCVFESVREPYQLSPWGIARLIRREVRRRVIVTRSELRTTIEPYLLAASFEGDKNKTILEVADAMVDVGELADLRVENQRGYSAIPARWIQLHDNDAVLLGTTHTETHRFSALHPLQFLRRFRPDKNIIEDLEQAGVSQQNIDDWFVEPAWMSYTKNQSRVDNLDELLSWHVGRLDSEGSPFDRTNTTIVALDQRPGDFFGSERKSQNSRWIPCSRAREGVLIGAQPGQNENHWIPVLLRVNGDGSCRSIPIHWRNEPKANLDLRNWLIVALGARTGRKERIIVDVNPCEIQCTFPMPDGIRKLMRLIGESTGVWQRYVVSNTTATGELLNRLIPEVTIAAA